MLNQSIQLLCQHFKIRVFYLLSFKGRGSQIPADSLVGFQNSVLKESRHRIIHWPTDTEYFNQSVNMFQYMNGIREHERIDVNELRNIRVRRINPDIFHMSEDVLIFTFSRFNDKERNSVLTKLIKNLINRITLSGPCRSRNKGVHIQTAVFQFDQFIRGLPQVEYSSDRHSVFRPQISSVCSHLITRHFFAKFSVFKYR